MASLDRVDTEQHTLLLDEIQDALECVICLDVPKHDPVYQCNHGHILCNSCHAKVTECPVCRVKLGSTRSLAVEKVLAKCPRPCEFNNYGCSIKLTKTALEKHQEGCAYKPVQCASPFCEKLVPIAEMIKHIDDNCSAHGQLKVEESHYNTTMEGITEGVKTPGYARFGIIRITLDGQYFFCACWRSLELLGPWHICLYMVGTPNESKGYIFTVKVINPDHIEELTYTGQSVSLQIGREEIRNEGRCLTFSNAIAKRFCRNDGIEFSISVRHTPKG